MQVLFCLLLPPSINLSPILEAIKGHEGDLTFMSLQGGTKIKKMRKYLYALPLKNCARKLCPNQYTKLWNIRRIKKLLVYVSKLAHMFKKDKCYRKSELLFWKIYFLKCTEFINITSIPYYSFHIYNLSNDLQWILFQYLQTYIKTTHFFSLRLLYSWHAIK